MKLKSLKNQVVVVFGASSGIGRATAHRLAQRGARVVVSARGEDGLETLVSEIRKKGGKAVAVPAEATSFEQVRSVAERAASEFGHLDTWIHCAAVSLYARFADTDPEEFRRVIDVNLNGQAFGAMAALPHIRREGRGALIHISSVEARRAMPYQAAYAASKHGVKAFLDALRMELREENIPISVTNVMPAGINTPLFNKARTKLGVKPKPVPPIYEPESVVRVIEHACEHFVDEVYAGGAAKVMSMGESASRTVMDAVLGRIAFRGQRTSEPKGAAAPDNLFEPVSGYDRVKGDFGAGARGFSLYNWIETHPGARNVLAGSALGALGWAATRAVRTRIRES